MAAPGYAPGFDLILHAERLDQPLGRQKPTVDFVGSMADRFHADGPDAFIERVLVVARQTPRHTDQILTQRAERLAAFFTSRPVSANVGLGITGEDRRYACRCRASTLFAGCPTRVRFLAVEPLLEDLGPLDLRGINGVIVGGESSPDARPMHEAWALSVRGRRRAAGVAFRFKPWVAWVPDGVRRYQKANGRILARRLWDERPESSGALL